MMSSLVAKPIESDNEESKPGPRSLFCVCQHNITIYVYGGDSNNGTLNDLWAFNVNTMKWKELKIDLINGVMPPKTKGSTMHYYNDKLWLIGGYNGNRHSRIIYSSIYVYSIGDNKWSEIKNVDSSIYEGIAFHKSELYQDKLLLFGGSEYKKVENTEYMTWVDKNELFIYHFNESIWDIIQLNNKPTKVIKHGMTIYDNLLIIFGGMAEQAVPPKIMILNTVYVLNIKKCLNINKNHIMSWIKLDLDMQYVYSHVMLHNPYSHSIICFGGSYNRRNGTRNNDLYMYYNMEAELEEHNTLSLLISGYMKQNIDMLPIEGIWIKIQHFCGMISFEYTINDIKERAGHNGCIIYVNNNTNLFIFGGYDGNVCLEDGYFISL